jgi:hypothetical protein
MQPIRYREPELTEPENRRVKVLADEARESARGGKARDSGIIRLRRGSPSRQNSPERVGRAR